MDDALAVVGQWIGLVKAAKLSMSEISRDCEERVAAGTVSMEDDFQQAVGAVFEALSALQVKLEEQEEELEEELDAED